MTTGDESLLLYAELFPAEIRSVQRRVREGTLKRIAPGVVTGLPEEAWPSLIARERIRVLAALYPKAVIGPRSAFYGGAPNEGVMYLSYTYSKRVALPGLTVQLLDGHGPAQGDAPMMGRELYFPSMPRVLLENLTVSRGKFKKSVGQAAVEQRLIETYEARGEEALGALRDQARVLAPTLGLEREFAILDGLIGGVLGTRKSAMLTAAGKALVAAIPHDANRLALFEKLAEELRSVPLKQPAAVAESEQGRLHAAFLESYFSNFIEGTEFGIEEARGFVLEGKPITARPKDSHDLIGVFRQALNPGWANQTLSFGEPVLNQLRDRHADQMKERPEVGPGEFKAQANRAGSIEFVVPRLVRGTLVEGSKLLPTVPPGTARALFAMFLVSEVHPFADGNGRLARLVMNAELSVVDSCRIIVPTLFQEEYLDCLRVLTREGNPKPFLSAMQRIHEWTAAFDYEDLDKVIADMRACNAFEKSRTFHKLLFPAKDLL
ncbi:Fic family protein [Paraburkholderia sp. UCT31]|uniref:Fic family protein n=1 Tax=Paraburkholderia sp. UCT31 TaxID=2615209 RepID=UPI001CA40C7D|nr:Fic family protein [Paraburkholderia sp. UCT31]